MNAALSAFHPKRPVRFRPIADIRCCCQIGGMRLLPSLLATSLLGCVATEHAAATCRSAPLSRAEAITILRSIPDGVFAQRHGARLYTNDWQGLSGDAGSNWHFQLVQYPSWNNPTGSGNIGYFSINRRTAVVRDLNGELVTGRELAAAQRRILRRPCRLRPTPAPRGSEELRPQQPSAFHP
jgi:hypothetical protein